MQKKINFSKSQSTNLEINQLTNKKQPINLFKNPSINQLTNKIQQINHIGNSFVSHFQNLFSPFLELLIYMLLQKGFHLNVSFLINLKLSLGFIWHTVPTISELKGKEGVNSRKFLAYYSL